MEPEHEQEPTIESPPDGSTCAEHPERPALVICPRCGSYACLSCWHGALKRCHACVARQPAPPVPWEDSSKGAIARLLGTVTDAASPIVTAPAFRASGTGRAAWFFALTFLPLAALSGIVPYTVTLLFGPSCSIAIEGTPTNEQIAFDVARAAGVGLLARLLLWAALAVPFVSLSNAFAEKGHPDAPLRAMLYRGWLLPLFVLLPSLVPIVLPAVLGQAALELGSVVAVIPLILLLSTMRATTRVGSGVGALTAVLTVAVPFALMIGAQAFLEPGVRTVLPELAQLEETQRVEAQRAETERSRREAPPTEIAPSETAEVEPTEPANEAAPSEPTNEAAPSEPTNEAAPSEPTNEAAPSEPTNEAAPSEPASATATQ